MKKYSKLISIALAVLMLVLAMPLSVFAETLTKEEVLINDSNLLIYIKNLKDTTNLVEGSEYGVDTTKNPYVAYTELDADGTIVRNSLTGKQWAYAAPTNISLDANSQYVITFKAQGLETGGTRFGGVFSGWNYTHSYNTLQHISWSGENPNSMYCTAGVAKWKANAYDTTVPYVLDFTTKVNDYIIVIDKMTVTIYCDNVKLYTSSVPNFTGASAENGSPLLTLGLTGYNQTSAVGNDVATMTDIKVYSGPYSNVVNNYTDGDTLLTMDTIFDASTVRTNFEDLTVTDVTRQNLYDNDDTAIIDPNRTSDSVYVNQDGAESTGAEAWTLAGVNTNLPLNANTKYTIEYYIKEYGDLSGNIAFCWAYSANNNAQGFFYYPATIGGIKGWAGDTYGRLSGAKYPTDNEGYTRYVVEIDGYNATAYIAGVRIGTLDFSKGGTDTYSSNTLTLIMKGHTFAANRDGSQPYVSVKNITVKAGNVETANTVEFAHNGTVIDTVVSDVNVEKNVIETFPDVEIAEGKLLKWFIKDTDIIVNAPYEITGDVTIEAREIDPYDIKVAGAQLSLAEGNLKSVRFIASLHSLQASETGFKISAKYKIANEDNAETAEVDETAVQNKTWDDIKSSVVYSSITTNTNGTIKSVTAEELGGTYLTALEVYNVPANYAQIDFLVSAYIVVDGEEIISDSVIISLVNGSFSADATELA